MDKLKSPDLSKLKTVRIDERTVIFTRKDTDEEVARQRFLARLRNSEAHLYRNGNPPKPKKEDTELLEKWLNADTD